MDRIPRSRRRSSPELWLRHGRGAFVSFSRVPGNERTTLLPEQDCSSRRLTRIRSCIWIATLGWASVAAAQKQPVSNGRIVGEVAAGILGVPLGFAAGYTIGSG